MGKRRMISNLEAVAVGASLWLLSGLADVRAAGPLVVGIGVGAWLSGMEITPLGLVGLGVGFTAAGHLAAVLAKRLANWVVAHAERLGFQEGGGK